MSKLIINKHQLRYIPEYDLYLQRVEVDNASVRCTCEHICSIYNICSSGYCRNKTRDPHYGNHGCADNGEQDAYKIICYRKFIMPRTQQGILKDFNILLKDTTHFKCILRKI